MVTGGRLLLVLALLADSARALATPQRIIVPRAKLQVAHSRSGGPGGQNVNKVNSKVELRFIVREADWLPEDVRARLEEEQRARINKEGELVVTASESRSQSSNLQLAIAKIQQMVDEASVPPKVKDCAQHAACGTPVKRASSTAALRPPRTAARTRHLVELEGRQSSWCCVLALGLNLCPVPSGTCVRAVRLRGTDVHLASRAAN
jgi:protein subunit release factor B